MSTRVGEGVAQRLEGILKEVKVVGLKTRILMLLTKHCLNRIINEPSLTKLDDLRMLCDIRDSSFNLNQFGS